MQLTDKIKSAVIIYNPISGPGKGKQYANEASRHLIRHGISVSAILRTEYAGHARQELIPEWHKQVDLMVIISGDGTLREVVSALIDLDSDCCLGFVPLGNANVVARELNIPIEPQQAIQALLSTQYREVDVGTFKLDLGELHYFIAMLEVGRGAKIVHIAQKLRNGSLQKLYRFWGDMIYVIAALLSFKPAEWCPFDIRKGEKTLTGNFFGVYISSMATYSKGWAVSPDACFDDGQLELVGSQLYSPSSFLYQMLAAVQRKTVHKPWISLERGPHFEISSKQGLYIQADGDAVDSSKSISVSVLPGAFRILVPGQ